MLTIFSARFFKKNATTLFKSILGLAFILGFSLIANAATPTLSVFGTGDGNSVQINVTGDPNASVLLYYMKIGVGANIAVIGTTNSSGSLSTVISSSQYGIASNTPVHITVGGINGSQSSEISWPSVNTTGVGTTTNPITLSQTGLVLSINQSATITANNTGSGAIYVSNNSNPSSASANVSGSQIVLTGLTNGSTNVTICSVGNTSNCPSVYVTVQNTGGQALTFSQNNITIGIGQNVPITVSGGNGIYTILNNSNSNVVSTSISGSTITLNATSTTGAASITVCSTNMVSCGIINVTIGTASSSAISFSQSNPTLPTGQSTNIIVSGGSGSYYISSNSNSNIVQASIANSTITLTGNTAGSATISVCASLGGCASLVVNVSYAASGGNIALSQSTLTLSTGQTLSVIISGGTAPYNLLKYSDTIFQGSIAGNILSISGISGGTEQIAVCSASGGCTWLTLVVNGSSSSSSTFQPVLSPSTLSLGLGQTSTVSISGTGSYYISGNTNPTVATIQISGNTASVSAIGYGTANVSICQSGGQCNVLTISVSSTPTNAPIPGCTSTVGYSTVTGQLCSLGGTPLMNTTTPSLITFSKPNVVLSAGQSATVTVYGGASSNYYVAFNSNTSAMTASMIGSTLSISGISNSAGALVICSSSVSCGALPVVIGVSAATTTTTKSTFQFTSFLSVGSTGNEVSELQKKLTTLGFYDGPTNGNFGPLTEAGVKAFQSAHGINSVGYVGPGTRAALNAN